MEKINSLFSSLGNWLTHPLRSDYPVWKMAIIFTLFLIFAYMVIDNLRVVREIASDITDAVID